MDPFFDDDDDGLYADNRCDHGQGGPKHNILITIGNNKQQPSVFDGTRLGPPTARSADCIPGLDVRDRVDEYALELSTRCVQLLQPKPQIIDHTSQTQEPVEIPDDVLYGTARPRSYGRGPARCDDEAGSFADMTHSVMTDSSFDSCPRRYSDVTYLREIEMEWDGIEAEVTAPMQPGPLQPSTSKDLAPEQPATLEGYEDVDFSQFPPVYAKLLKLGCTAVVAECFLGLVDEGLLGEVVWEHETTVRTLQNISWKSNHEEEQLMSFLEEFRNHEFDGHSDKFLLFKQKYRRYCKGYKFLSDEVTPLQPLDQLRIEDFYESEIAKGYKVFVKAGCRRYCAEEEDGDEMQDSYQIFVGRIPYDCYEDELIAKFCSVGKIRNFILMMDSQSNQNRGFGFLNYEDPALADAAINLLDQSFIRPGKKIGLKRGLNHNRLFFGGLPRHLTKDEFLEEFKKVFPGVTDVILNKDNKDLTKNRGFVFVDFTDGATARAAQQMAKQGRYKIAGAVVTNADWARVLEKPVEQETLQLDTRLRKVFVRGVSSVTTEEAIYFAFLFCGDIAKVRKPPGDYAFVEFTSHEDALSAVEHPPKQICGRDVHVSWCTPSRKRHNDHPEHNDSKRHNKTQTWAPPDKHKTHDDTRSRDHSRHHDYRGQKNVTRWRSQHRNENKRSSKDRTDTSQWQWGTGKQKLKKKPPKEKSRKLKDRSRKTVGSNISVLNTRSNKGSVLHAVTRAKLLAMDCAAQARHRVASETEFQRITKASSNVAQFNANLDEGKRLKERANILNFFDIDEPSRSRSPSSSSCSLASPPPVFSKWDADICSNERPPTVAHHSSNTNTTANRAFVVGGETFSLYKPDSEAGTRTNRHADPPDYRANRPAHSADGRANINLDPTDSGAASLRQPSHQTKTHRDFVEANRGRTKRPSSNDIYDPCQPTSDGLPFSYKQNSNLNAYKKFYKYISRDVP